MILIQIVQHALTVYIITCVICRGSIFDALRREIKAAAPGLQIPGYPHYIECRLCVGLSVAGVVVILNGCVLLLFPVYGLAYFLSTQER